MASLAIKGHPTRGSEVIALLEMLGGINSHNLYGDESYSYYTIDSDKEIKGGIYVFGDEQLCYFTLEEFEEKFPYKVGDKVITDDGDTANIVGMIWDNDIDDVFYDTQICNEVFKYPKELLEPYKGETTKTITIDDFKTNTKEWLIDKLHGMIISDAIKTIGNLHDELHKPQYPKTYEECCEVLGIRSDWHLTLELDIPATHDLSVTKEFDYVIRLESLRKLSICRNAYWKIAGKQMGLDTPWEPDWKDDSDKYFICYLKDELWMFNIRDCNRFLVFPTKEMRSAFYESFKDLIENCKELL